MTAMKYQILVPIGMFLASVLCFLGQQLGGSQMNFAIIVLYVFLCLLAAGGIALCFVIIRQDYEIKLLRSDLKRLQDDVFDLSLSARGKA